MIASIFKWTRLRPTNKTEFKGKRTQHGRAKRLEANKKVPANAREGSNFGRGREELCAKGIASTWDIRLEHPQRDTPRSLSASDKMRAIKDLVSQGSGSGWGAARRFPRSSGGTRWSYVPPQHVCASFSALLLVQLRKSNPGSAWQCDAWANQRKAIRPIIAMFSKRRRISEIDKPNDKICSIFLRRVGSRQHARVCNCQWQSVGFLMKTLLMLCFPTLRTRLQPK